MSKLHWEKLLCETRLKPKEESTGTKGFRTELERDYDRVLFAPPTRRLADKTQVFPLDPSDSVRSRLTHSYEVSNLARSIGVALAFEREYANRVFGDVQEELEVKRNVPALLAAIGLVHDWGNPPFGHQGEVAIGDWFKTHKGLKPHEDFKNFDGNPQTFRLLTRLQILNDRFGLNLTCATLAAMLKYPYHVSSKGYTKEPKQGGHIKFGFFESEKSTIRDVWRETGLSKGVRHPFAHIMNACDDMAYAVIDAEDIVKKRYASFHDLMGYLDRNKCDRISKLVKDKAERKNCEFKSEDLNPEELDDMSMQLFRVFAIHDLVEAVTKCFVENINEIMDCNTNHQEFDLIDKSGAREFCDALKKFDKDHGYSNKQVLELELKGQNYISNTMNMLWEAIRDKDGAFSKFAWAVISENYKRVHKDSEMDENYADCQLLSDFISGMTDKYLIKIHDQLTPLYNAYKSGKTIPETGVDS